jgi:uncharacterized protein
MRPGNGKTAVAKMLAKANSKLAAAKIDFENKLYDDSVSRAYYAVFHCIGAMLLSRGMHFSSHSETIGAFNKNFVKTGDVPAEFTKMIKKLFDGRQTGDYDFDISLSKEEAKEGIVATEKIITTCEEYLKKLA